jgi:hypothetical protein
MEELGQMENDSRGASSSRDYSTWRAKILAMFDDANQAKTRPARTDSARAAARPVSSSFDSDGP